MTNFKMTLKGPETEEMNAWTQLNQLMIDDRIRERSNAAADERRAAEARLSSAKAVRQPRFRFVFASNTDQAPSKA